MKCFRSAQEVGAPSRSRQVGQQLSREFVMAVLRWQEEKAPWVGVWVEFWVGGWMGGMKVESFGYLAWLIVPISAYLKASER